MPIERNENLKAISREHHHSLLLCWKIRTGFKKDIDLVRIKSYVNWYYTNHLQPHFEIEEKYIFPILGKKHKLVKKAITEHLRLSRLFEESTDLLKSLTLIEEELESHIRFEERVLFNEIQSIATRQELELIKNVHSEEQFKDNVWDTFWL